MKRIKERTDFETEQISMLFKREKHIEEVEARLISEGIFDNIFSHYFQYSFLSISNPFFILNPIKEKSLETMKMNKAQASFK